MKIKALIFDVNETLLDMTDLKNKVNLQLENPLAFDLWFSKLLHYSLVENEIDTHNDFTSIAIEVFKMTAYILDKTISEDKIIQILGGIKSLPAHPDVVESLAILSEEYKLIALTNGNQETVEDQLKFANIHHYFDAIYSVDVVGKFKPDPKTYFKVLSDHNLEAEETLMVAAHAWDIAGSQNAGLRTAFIKRKGKSLYKLNGKPDIVLDSLNELKHRISTK